MKKDATRQSATRPESPQSNPGRMRSESPSGYVVARASLRGESEVQIAGASQAGRVRIEADLEPVFARNQRMREVAVRVTADVSGKKTNRVRAVFAKKCCGTGHGEPHRDDCLQRYRNGRHKNRYARDVEVGTCVKVCISLPPGELEQLDALASRTRMARSHLIREAVRAFAANSNKPEEP